MVCVNQFIQSLPNHLASNNFILVWLILNRERWPHGLVFLFRTMYLPLHSCQPHSTSEGLPFGIPCLCIIPAAWGPAISLRTSSRAGLRRAHTHTSTIRVPFPPRPTIHSRFRSGPQYVFPGKSYRLPHGFLFFFTLFIHPTSIY